jgi:hypothetical protein
MQVPVSLMQDIVNFLQEQPFKHVLDLMNRIGKADQEHRNGRSPTDPNGTAAR